MVCYSLIDMGHPVVLLLLLIIVLILITGGILMTVNRKDPLRNCRFRVEIDGIAQASPCQISGIEAAIESIEYREGADPLQVRQLGGLPKYGTLILKYGLTNSKELYDWFKSGIDGKVEPRKVSIIASDLQGNDMARWNLVNAWPAKYLAPDFNGRGNDVALETFEIVYEGLERET
jgi:phage tail-like protein